MQRLVPGAKAQPEQHWWPPQTLGLNRGGHIQTPGLTWDTGCTGCRVEGPKPLHDKLIWLQVIVSDHSDVAGLLIWTPWGQRCNCILFDKNFQGKSRNSIWMWTHKSLFLRAKTNTGLSEPWKDYERHTGHEKHPASSINHWANERWQVLNSYNWILCTL